MENERPRRRGGTHEAEGPVPARRRLERGIEGTIMCRTLSESVMGRGGVMGVWNAKVNPSLWGTIKFERSVKKGIGKRDKIGWSGKS